MKWWVKATSTLITAKWHPLVSFSSIYHTKLSMAKSISQSCGELQPAVCLSRGRWSHLKIIQALVDAKKPQKQATAKQLGNLQRQYLPDC